mmetsp:Transcript_59398/g.128433  ORF Transcript_59398/g.128433 Transcript_59398/m.128433 type:complete len:255 (+) Transcript_59398:938-1702(+)
MNGPRDHQLKASLADNVHCALEVSLVDAGNCLLRRPKAAVLGANLRRHGDDVALAIHPVVGLPGRRIPYCQHSRPYPWPLEDAGKLGVDALVFLRQARKARIVEGVREHPAVAVKVHRCGEVVCLADALDCLGLRLREGLGALELLIAWREVLLPMVGEVAVKIDAAELLVPLARRTAVLADLFFGRVLVLNVAVWIDEGDEPHLPHAEEVHGLGIALLVEFEDVPDEVESYREAGRLPRMHQRREQHLRTVHI